MVQRCKICSRVNPHEAIYCYYDGFVLVGHGRVGGPVAVGGQQFSSPFVFPTGRTCRSFDELALACQQDWAVARELLKEGYLETFFGGLGRLDLAQAAKEAARYPDLERGLDQLLGILPTQVLTEAKLRVEPVEVNLGQLNSDEPRRLEIELENQGMRLLYGTLTCSETWLTLGEPPGVTEKRFHFTQEYRIPLHIHAGRVRASDKPIEARVLVQSNAGAATILLRAEKQIKPFPAGPLEGVRTPRQVAERAQASPREIVPLFESGAVAQWYASNGWVYPVKVPVASGVAAIQQFFEALGMTRAPKVEISHKEVHLSGYPGSSISLNVEVSTQERRPVFAHAQSEASWLEVSKPRLTGRTAVLPLLVPSVPDQPGQTLMTKLEVISNGNKRWRVPVRLRITAKARAEELVTAEESGDTFDFPVPVAPRVTERRPSRKTKAVERATSSSASGRTRRLAWLHALPAMLLVACVAGVVGYDLGGGRGGSREHRARASIAGPNYDPRQLAEASPRVGVRFNEQDRFGIVLLDPHDPADPSKWKRLTASDVGATNNTVVKIGANEYLFGYRTPSNMMTRRHQPLPEPYVGWTSVMEFRQEQIRVTQYVQIVPGPENLLDTVLIYYQATNYGTVAQKVALRILLDTYIGKNDGVPFTVPGEKGFVTKQAEYRGEAIPDYLEMVENPEDSKDAGTIARIGLKGISWGEVDLLEPERVRICRFPGAQIKWDWEPEDMSEDSCVAVYWPEQELGPRKTMQMAMTYGVGKLEISDRLALSGPVAIVPGREFVVTAYVYEGEKDQKVTIELPEGLELVGEEAEQTLMEQGRRTQVFWKVRALREGSWRIEAVSGRSRARPIVVTVRKRSIFG